MLIAYCLPLIALGTTRAREGFSPSGSSLENSLSLAVNYYQALCYMSASTQSNSFIAAAVLAVLLATSACTRTSADNAHSQATTSQAQQPPAKTTSVPAPELASQDAQPAIASLTRAADAGDASAMYRLGRMYATGSGVEKDYVEAFNWYKRAAAKGNSDAMYALGEAYEHGHGVREDIQRAVNWYDEATLHGNKSAKAALDRLGESFDR